MKTIYKTKGTCSDNIAIELEDGIVKDIKFGGGCDGNLKGISELVKGMKVSEVIKRLEGIKCGSNKSSCPDQLAQALREMSDAK